MLVGLGTGLAACGGGSGQASTPSLAETTPISVDPGAAGPRIPSGFLGLGFEYRALSTAGGTPTAPDPVLTQLVRNLSPGQAPILRIGGDTTDWSWVPVPGQPPPPGMHYELTPQRIAVDRAITRQLGASLILGVNLEADDGSLAATEAQALITGIGRQSILALELGNEPELYHSFGWYKLPNGTEVPGRPANYDFPMFEQEFTSIASALPPVPVAGPTTGGPWWEPDWSRFLDAEPRVRLATVHRYPLHACSKRSSPIYPTIDHLLSPVASQALAQSTQPLARLAHSHHIPLRVDEMNVTPCPQRAVEMRAFAAALWAPDVLFAMARAGVDGVNLQTTTGGTQDLFTIEQAGGSWQAQVEPEYYGLLLFAHAAPAGSRLIRLAQPPAPLRAWATRASDGRVRVLVINQGPTRREVAVAIPGATRPARLERLLAPSAEAQQGITLGGHTFGAWTQTGRLAGDSADPPIASTGGRYPVALPAHSAALLTVS